MLTFIIRRCLLMVVTLIAVSIISFIIIQAPPGDFLSYYIANLMSMGERIDPAELEAIKVRYGLGQPLYLQYFKWVWNLLHGDLGRSMQLNMQVSQIIIERLPGSFTISLVSLIFVYAVGIPVGVYSATHQYSIGDYFFTLLGFIGVAIPNFLLALILLWFYFVYTGNVAVGLFSHEVLMAPWSLAKFFDLLKHLWLPVIIIGTAGTCGTIRVVRNNLLDELSKPYVVTARAKGLPERRLLYKYPFRIAINPVISTIGWTLPSLVSGEMIVSLVLNTPTLAPVFMGALRSQDMFLAGSIVFVLSFLTVIGTLISDLLLAWIDPRVRYE